MFTRRIFSLAAHDPADDRETEQLGEKTPPIAPAIVEFKFDCITILLSNLIILFERLIVDISGGGQIIDDPADRDDPPGDGKNRDEYAFTDSVIAVINGFLDVRHLNPSCALR